MGREITFGQLAAGALKRAQAEAANLDHEYVGTEHILLGLIGGGDPEIDAVLDRVRVERPRLRDSIRGMLGSPAAGAQVPTDSEATCSERPFTSRSKKVIEEAMCEARDTGASGVSTVHLFAGILREGKGVGAAALEEFGVTLARYRSAMERPTA